MSPIDIAIIVVYMVSMVLIGIACRGKQSSESDYFTGHGGFSSLLGTVLVGLSIAATFFSGISMLAYPSVAFQKGAAIFLVAAILVLAALIAGGWFLPRYLNTGTREPYEIIERKFGYSTRVFAAVFFLLLRITWMGTLIYAPTSALVGGFGLDQRWFWMIVIGIGLTSTLYTVFGGIRGVIVTDAIQFIVMIAGILVPVVMVVQRLAVDRETIYQFLNETGRLQVVSFSLNPVEPFTFWAMLCGFMVGNLGMYIGDQMALQRYLASDDIRDARKAFVINVCGIVVVISLLVVMGMALWIYYNLIKPELLPARPDDAFPLFIATELPVGIPGLIFAAILAATMSSMTSGINALAGTIVLDFLSRSAQFSQSKRRLLIARSISLVIGILATGTAGFVGGLGSIFEIAQSLTGVFLGPLVICMLLAVSDRRFNTVAVQVGMVMGAVAGWLVIFSPADRLWVGPAAALGSAICPLAEFGFRTILQRTKPDQQVAGR